MCGQTGSNPDLINVKTEPPQSILSPPITPPEPMEPDDDFNIAEYLRVMPQQDQSVLSMFHPQATVKQEEPFNANQIHARVQSQNTLPDTQQGINLLQAPKTQQELPAMYTKSLEELLKEPSKMIAPNPRASVAVTPHQSPVYQPQSVLTQQVGNPSNLIDKSKQIP